MPADKVEEEQVDEEMPDAAEVKQEQQASMVRERTVGQGNPFSLPSKPLTDGTSTFCDNAVIGRMCKHHLKELNVVYLLLAMSSKF